MVLPVNPAALEKLAAPGSLAYPLTIRETTGGSRQIVLRGRSLPHRGVEFPSEQRVQIDYHPGNPQAEAQVLGPKWGPTTLRGRWSDAFLDSQGNGALLFNFPPLGIAGRALVGVGTVGGPTFQAGGSVPGSIGEAQRARAIRDAVYMIQRGGQKLRVEWGSIVRYGHLVRFTPSHAREEDISWEMEFEWQGDSDAPLKIRTKAPLDPAGLLAKILAAIQKFLDEANAVLAQILGAQLMLQSKITAIASAVTGLIQLVQGFVNLALVPAQILGTLQQALTSIMLAIRDLIATIRGLFSFELATKNGGSPAAANLAAEAAAAILYQARLLGIDMALTLQKLTDLAGDEVLATVQITADQTLRDVAAQYYGEPSSWQRIADYNELSTSRPAAGTIIRVPR
jgi:nucleoid-associated protein YgaU